MQLEKIYEELSYKKDEIFTELALARAAAQLNIKMIQWLRDKGIGWSPWACAAVAQHEKNIELHPGASTPLETLKFLRESGCPWNQDTADLALENCNQELLDTCRENGLHPRDSGHERFNAVRRVLSHLYPWTVLPDKYDVMKQAAIRGDVQGMKQLYENGCEPTLVVSIACALMNHMEALEWCHSVDCPMDEATATSAMCTGNLDMVRKVLEWGCPMDIQECIQVCLHFDYPHILRCYCELRPPEPSDINGDYDDWWYCRDMDPLYALVPNQGVVRIGSMETSTTK